MRALDDPTATEVDQGVIGEVHVRSETLMAGYIGEPRDKHWSPDGWLRTGDLAIRDAYGYLHLVGRTKDSYRCGGEQVVPGDVEAVLARHPSVHQAFVVPVPDARSGEAGWAWVVPRARARRKRRPRWPSPAPCWKPPSTVLWAC